jgi:hypothetical protein
MRVFIVLIVAALALDWIAFQGDYSGAVWKEAKREGHLLSVEADRLRAKFGW